MKTFQLAFLLTVFSALAINAQELQFVSSTNGSAVPNAEIAINCAGDPDELGQVKQVKNLKTDLEGKIVLPSELACSAYFFTVSHKDYEDFSFTGKLGKMTVFKLNPLGKHLDEVVVTAQYQEGSVENAVQKIRVIDKVTIDKMGAQNLRDVLSNSLNIRLSQDNVLGSSMSLQGISGQNVKILIDGVAVTGRVNGNIDLSQINMNNVERIEIVEGPLSVSYGTDALAGTINIITKKFQKPSSSASVTGYYESVGQYNYSGRLAHSTKNYTFSLLGGRNYFDGWKYEDSPFKMEKEEFADSNRVMDWKPKEQFFGTVFIGRQLKRTKLGLTSDYFYEQIMNRGLPREPYYETAFDDYYATNRFNNSFSITGKAFKNTNINLIFANNRFKRVKNTYINDLTTLKQTLTANASDQDTTTFNSMTSRGTFSSSRSDAKINGEIGYDFQHEIGTGLRIKDNKQQIADYAIFISAEYKPFEKTVIRPGIRTSYNTSYQAPVIPSVNIRQEIGKGNVLRFSYARGFRAPSLKDLYFYFVDVNHNIKGNEELKAEYSHNFSLNYNRAFTIKQIELKLENSYFYNSNGIYIFQLKQVQNAWNAASAGASV
jgi:outer membrane receptor for ferrienterochelin and colicins